MRRVAGVLRCRSFTQVVGGLFDHLRQNYAAYKEQQSAGSDESDGGGGFVSSPARRSLPRRRIRATPGACPRSVLRLSPADALLPLSLSLPARPFAFARGAEPDAVMFDLSAPRSRCAAARDAVLRHIEAEAKAEEKAENENETEVKAAGGRRWRRRYILRVSCPVHDARNGLLDLELAALLGPRLEAVALPPAPATATEPGASSSAFASPSASAFAFASPSASSSAFASPSAFASASASATESWASVWASVEPLLHPAQRLWAVFDSPRAVAAAAAVCAQRRFDCAVFDGQRLAPHLGIAAPGKGPDLFWFCACQVILAARASGMYVLDGPYADASDTAGFARDLQGRSRELGFDGRVVSHGSQVAMCNAAFVPTEAEMEWAQDALSESSNWSRTVQLLKERHIDAEMERDEQKHAKERRKKTQSSTTENLQEEKGSKDRDGVPKGE